MVKIKKKFVISLFLTAFLVVVNSIGYGQNSPVPKRISASKLFPVMTWYGLTAQQLDIAHFKELADAGFTVNFSNLGSYELNKKALNLAEKVGIKLIIGDKRIQPGKSVDAAAIKNFNLIKIYFQSKSQITKFQKVLNGNYEFKNI